MDQRRAVLMCGASIDLVVEHLVTLTASGKVRSGRRDEARRLVESTLERWLSKGRIEAAPGGGFDPVACVNEIKRSARTGDDEPLWEGCVATGRALVSSIPPDGRDPRGTEWTLRWRRFVPAASVVRTPSGSRIRVPIALESHHANVEVLSATCNGEAASKTRRVAGGMDVFVDGSGDADVTIVTRFAEGHPPSDAPDGALHLRDRDGLAKITPWVRDHAESLGDDPIDGAWRFLFDRMLSGSVPHHRLDDDDPLRALVSFGVFDCLGAASLMVATWRARGICSRIAGGIALYPSAPFQHFWAEAFVGGCWRPYDVMAWDLARGRIDDEEWSRRFFGRADARLTFSRTPDAVTGPAGFRPPATWFVLASLTQDGSAQSMHDATTGALVCRDEIAVDGPHERKGRDGCRAY